MLESARSVLHLLGSRQMSTVQRESWILPQEAQILNLLESLVTTVLLAVHHLKLLDTSHKFLQTLLVLCLVLQDVLEHIHCG